MAKKYFWLKLKIDFFKTKEIKLLRRVAGGDTFTIIYLEMLLESLKSDGVLYFDGVCDDMAEEIALLLDEEVENVRLTLNYLQHKNLMELGTNDDLKLTRVNEMIGSETDSAERVRRLRERQSGVKALHCNSVVTDGNTEKEKEKEKDKDIDIEIEKKGPPAKKEIRHKYGEFGNVYLTDLQKEKLFKDFGETITKEYIDRADKYVQEFGKKYKDFSLTIRRWIEKDGKGGKNGRVNGYDFTHEVL